ncbi:DUF2279 domain-containing protein [Flavobacterium sp. IMCC34852]|uniref:DUF2279 domain-containing protein n=1 Tax=Flavobacterium rivulicola TaxID=2732161 RepID=A0A7Y3VYU9_9FLAO|nr:DUF2279 domain-containing protein [Flavobacterium sp. IMCC34852]
MEHFLKPSDTLNTNRLKTLVISEVAIGATALIGLNQVWYADYPRSDFHFINDNAEWLQMDKAGHVFSAYHLGSFGANALKWSGSSRKSQLLYGSTLGLAFLTTVEVFDGYSANWGASLGDVIANVSGTALFVSQDLLWKEQRIVPKFSFHTTPYATARPTVLGSTLSEQILKDYNGQTYWLSANIYSFAKTSKIPKWLNIAIGYGAEGMITGNEEFVNTIFLPESKRYRQFYLSLDVDLTKIETKSHFVKTILTIFNTIKIPAPTFEIKGCGGSKLHLIYF